jgi:predicted permease
VLINDKMNTYNKRSIVWHNSLVKSRSNLNLHQKLWERNKIMFIPLHLLKTYIMNLRQKQNYVYALPPLLILKETSWIRVCIYARAKTLFPNLG